MSWASKPELRYCILPSMVPKTTNKFIQYFRYKKKYFQLNYSKQKSVILLWSGIAMDHQYWVRRIVHEPNIPVQDFDDSSRTVNCLTVVTLQYRFGPNNKGIEEQALYATKVHAKYSRTSRIHTPNAARVQLHHSEVLIRMYSCHVPCK